MKMSLQSILVTLGLVLGLVSSTWADGNPGDYLHTRTYVGLLGTSVSVGSNGLFSGSNYSVVQSPAYDLSLIPSLASATGWGFLIGHREEAYALEVSYWQSSHTANFNAGVVGTSTQASVTIGAPAQGTAILNSINIDFKRYFLTDLQFQPFLDLGVVFPWVDIADADIDGNGNVTTLTLSGLGLNLGVGIEYYLSPNFSVTASAYQRWASFDQFRGSQVEYNTLSGTSSDEASGMNFAVGVTAGLE